MASVQALPSCFDYFTKENKKVYVTPLFTSPPPTPDPTPQECNCVCPLYVHNTTGPWTQLGATTSSYFTNSMLGVLGMLFVCVLARQTIARTCEERGLDEWREAFCEQDVKGKIRTVLEILDAKEHEVRAAKDRIKCAEKHVRMMKLSTNQVHAAILCQMVKLREALDWVERNPSGDCDGSIVTVSTCSSDLDVTAQIALLESQIHKLTAEKNRQSDFVSLY
ncbi:hypothetical protein M8J77_007930 [Diaphorina citri]|nr:hypothetical protein M8J77_007930 [Diaphorina citri]